jgi:tRNA(fMet)-specific endonuclease VapC
MYLLDTNACLDFLLGRRAAILPRIERAFDRLAVSSISAAELHVGNRRSASPEDDARRVDHFLNALEVLDFDDRAARSYAKVIRLLGIDRTSFDRLIAAHALSLDFTLITNNVRHFADVPGLKVENWAE